MNIQFNKVSMKNIIDKIIFISKSIFQMLNYKKEQISMIYTIINIKLIL